MYACMCVVYDVYVRMCCYIWFGMPTFYIYTYIHTTYIAPRPHEVPARPGPPAVRPASEVHAVPAEDHDGPGGEVQLRPHQEIRKVHVTTYIHTSRNQQTKTKTKHTKNKKEN